MKLIDIVTACLALRLKANPGILVNKPTLVDGPEDFITIFQDDLFTGVVGRQRNYHEMTSHLAQT